MEPKHAAEDNRPLPYPTGVVVKAPLSWKTLIPYLKNAKKALINITGLLGVILGLEILSEPYNNYAATAFAVLTAYAHYVTANDAPPTIIEPEE